MAAIDFLAQIEKTLWLFDYSYSDGTPYVRLTDWDTAKFDRKRGRYRTKTRKVVAAMREPTAEMITQGDDVLARGGTATEVWRAMADEALPAEDMGPT